MNWIEFVIRMSVALGLGAIIGLERQWRQRMTGLRTNGLVAAVDAEDATITASRELVDGR